MESTRRFRSLLACPTSASGQYLVPNWLRRDAAQDGDTDGGPFQWDRPKLCTRVWLTKQFTPYFVQPSPGGSASCSNR